MKKEKFPAVLDATDRRLLNLLQKDAKISISELERITGLTKTPIYERIRRLEREGFISDYVALIDRKKTEAGIIVFCIISLEQQKMEHHVSLQEAVNGFPEVMEAYATGGGYDFVLKIIVPNLDGYYKFASQKLAVLPHIGNINSLFVLNEVKYTTAVEL